jgi:sugar phosphate isomerase/epimerase
MLDTLDIAISQLTTARWDLADDLDCLQEHGIKALSLWRPKLSDRAVAETRAALERTGIRCSSLQHAGGFTGGDGRTFRESLADAEEALEAAGQLGAPVLVVHSGCRGGHTRSHASRLLRDALETLAPTARRRGVLLALKPVHPAAACGCSFLTDLAETLDLLEAVADPAVGLALDLWQFGGCAELEPLLPRLAAAAVLVQVADRSGPPTAEVDRLPPGHGGLPLEALVGLLQLHGYTGDLEFDPVGETVEVLGYAGTIGEIRRVADAWQGRSASCEPVGPPCGAAPGRPVDATLASAALRSPLHLRAGAGSRRSQASSQAVSRG